MGQSHANQMHQSVHCSNCRIGIELKGYVNAHSSGLLLCMLRSVDRQYYNVDVIGVTELLRARVNEYGLLAK